MKLFLRLDQAHSNDKHAKEPDEYSRLGETKPVVMLDGPMARAENHCVVDIDYTQSNGEAACGYANSWECKHWYKCLHVGPRWFPGLTRRGEPAFRHGGGGSSAFQGRHW